LVVGDPILEWAGSQCDSDFDHHCSKAVLLSEP
jgi:hypothetical protein